MNMINTNLWEKYNSLLNENSNKGAINEGGFNIVAPDSDVYKNIDANKRGQLKISSKYGKDEFDNDRNFLKIENASINKLLSKTDERTAFECMKVLRGIIRNEINANKGLSDKALMAAKSLGYNEEQINDFLSATLKSPDGESPDPNWRGGVLHGLMNIYESLDTKYGVYYMANPKYVEDPEEALQNGVYFEPAYLLIIHYQNENLQDLNIAKNYSLDYEEMDEDVANIGYQWSFFKLKNEKYAYTSKPNEPDNNQFIILKLNGTWEDEYLDSYKLTYAVNAILLNTKNNLVVNEGKNDKIEKSVSVIFKGESLPYFYENQENYPDINKEMFSYVEPGSEFSISKDSNFIYKNNIKMLDFLSPFANEISRIAEDEYGITNFPSNKYLFANLGNSNISNINVAWTKPDIESIVNEFWSPEANKYNRDEIDRSVYPLKKIEGEGSTNKSQRMDLISSIGRLFSNKSGKVTPELEKKVYQIYFSNPDIRIQCVSAITNKWKGVDKEIFEKGLVTQEDLENISFLTFLINGLGPEYEATKTKPFNDEIYKRVFRTFRSAYYYHSVENEKEVILPVKDLEEGSFQIDHIEGTHGNAYFGNLRLVNQKFNQYWEHTIGFFVFELTPKKENDQNLLINWSLTYNKDYRVILPIGNSPELTEDFSIENNFQDMFELKIYGSDNRHGFDKNIYSLNNVPANSPVKLCIKGITVFEGNKESREIYAGLMDIENSGFKNIKTGEDIDYSNIHNIRDTLRSKGHNYQQAQNANGEVIQRFIDKRYKNFTNRDNNSSANNDTTVDNVEDNLKTTTVEGTMFSNIISDFVQNLNEESNTNVNDASGNRKKQVMRQCEFKNMTLKEICNMMIKSYRASKKMSGKSDKTTTRSSTTNLRYLSVEFGIRTDNELLLKYEGNSMEDWLEGQYIEIHSNKTGNNVEFDEAENKWKCIPNKMPNLRVSRLGRVLYRKNQYKPFELSTVPLTGTFLNGYMKEKSSRKLLHIMVASTWKEKECNITINQERRASAKDKTPLNIVVHHINGNQTDTRAENLEWVNTRDNTIFDSGKAIALFRVIPGTREEIPLLAWPTKKSSTFRDPKTNQETNVYVDTFWGGNGKMISNTIRLPEGALKEKRVDEAARLGRNTITSDSVLYILRNVVLLDRKDKERTEFDRINDIIGYEQIIKGNKVMINDSTGVFIEIPTKLDKVETKNIPYLYLRGNISIEVLLKEIENRPDRTTILKKINEQKSRLRKMDVLTRIDTMNKNGYNIHKMDEEGQKDVWNTDESGMIPEDKLKVVFNELLKGNVAMFILTDPIIKQLYNLYINSPYSIFNGGPDITTEKVNIATFEKEAKKYYYKNQKLLNNNEIYNIAMRKGSFMIDSYFKGYASYEEFINYINGKQEKDEILETLRSKEQSLSILKAPDKLLNLASGRINVFQMDTTDQDIIWGSENGILKDPDLSYVMKRMNNYLIPIYVIPKNTVQQYMDRTSEKMDIEDFYNTYEQKRLERKKEMKMRKLNRQESAPQERGLELSGIQSKIANLLEDLNKLSL